jgi:hypothetical protein
MANFSFEVIHFCQTILQCPKTRLKGYKYFEIERDLFNKLGVLVDGDFKFGVLLLVFVGFLGGDTGNLYRNGNFTADLQNVSFMSLDESIGKIEVDPKEEASVVEVFQDVLDKLSDVGKKDKLLKFKKII